MVFGYLISKVTTKLGEFDSQEIYVVYLL